MNLLDNWPSKMHRHYYTLFFALFSCISTHHCIAQGYLGKQDRISFIGASSSNIQTIKSFINPSLHGGIEYVRTLNRNVELGVSARLLRGRLEDFTLYTEGPFGDRDQVTITPRIKGGAFGMYLNSYLYRNYSSVAPIGFYIQCGLDFNEWHLGEDINPFGQPTSPRGYQLTQFSFLTIHAGFGQQAVWGERVAAGWVVRTSLPLKYFREPDDLVSGNTYVSDSYKITDSPMSLFRYTAITLEFSVGYFF